MDDLDYAFCPYKGLEPYTESDHPFFFGRERDADIITANLYAARLTVLYGASGVGKSSVLLAAVAPRFAKDERASVVVFREWRASTFRIYLRKAAQDAPRSFSPQATDFAPELPLDDFLSQQREKSQRTFYFILDQFEDYLLHHFSESGRNGFEAELARAINRRDVDANFLIVIREDCLSKLDRFRGRIPNLLANGLRLDYLQRSEASDAILKPLVEFNRRRVPTLPSVGISDDLVEAVLKQVRVSRVGLGPSDRSHIAVGQFEDPDDFGVEMPLLQLMMTRLWDKARAESSRLSDQAGSRKLDGSSSTMVALGVDHLEELGGARKIVSSHLDLVMRSVLTDPQRNLAAQLFRFLVTPSGSTVAQTAGDLRSYANLGEGLLPEVESVLNQLCSPKARILRMVTSIPDNGATARFEVLHDVLAEAVLDWTRESQMNQEVKKQLAEESRLRRRKLGRFFLGATGLVLLATLTCVALWAIWASDEANRAMKTADEKSRSAMRVVSRYLAALSAGQRESHLDVSLLLAVKAFQSADTFEARASLFQALKARKTPTSFLHVEEGSVSCVAFSPDEGKIALGYATQTEGGGGGIVLWDTRTHRRLGEKPLALSEGWATSLAFSHDGKMIAAGYKKGYRMEGGLILWDSASHNRLRNTPLVVGEGEVSSIAFSPDGKIVAAGCRGMQGNEIRGGLVLWDAGTHNRLVNAPLSGVGGDVSGIAFSPDGKLIAAGYNAGTRKTGGVVLWDVNTNRVLTDGTLAAHGSDVTSVAFSPNGKTIAAGYQAGSKPSPCGVDLWDVHSHKRLTDQPLVVNGSRVSGLAFMADGQTLLAGYLNDGFGKGGVAVWKYSADRKFTFDGTINAICKSFGSVVISPKEALVAVTLDSSVELWEASVIADVLLRDSLPVGEGDVSSLAYSPDGRTLAAGCDIKDTKGGVVLWDVTSRNRVTDKLLEVEGGPVQSVVFSPDSTKIAAKFLGDGGSGVVLWEAASRKLLTPSPLAVKGSDLSNVAFRPGSSVIAVGYSNLEGCGVVLWDTSSLKILAKAPLGLKGSSVTSLAFSPDGNRLVAAYDGQENGAPGGVALWETSDSRNPRLGPSVTVSEGFVPRLAFSPDGKTLAVAYFQDRPDGGVIFYDAVSLRQLDYRPVKVEASQGWVWDMSLSPDGRMGAVVCINLYGIRSKGVLLWDSTARRWREQVEVGPFPLEDAIFPRSGFVAFSPDGKELAVFVGSNDFKGLTLWDMDPQSWMRLASRIANRNLTRDEWSEYLPDETYPTALRNNLPAPTQEASLDASN